MLKYQSEISRVKGCPNTDFHEIELIAFHFVFKNETNAKKNFLPAIKKNPKRGVGFKKQGQLCRSYSLSMFESKSGAMQFYSNLQKINKNIGKSIGDSLASGQLKRSYGLYGDKREYGHFSFFIYNNIDLNLHFEIIKERL